MMHVLLMLFYLFYPVIILKACIFKSSVTNNLLDKLLRVLQLLKNLSKLTANG